MEDERDLTAGGKFNSVAMVDISILETLGTFWERVLTRPHRGLRKSQRVLRRPQREPRKPQPF